MSLRWRAAGGAQRTIAIVLGSLSFKAVLLAAGIVLAFWPAAQQERPEESEDPHNAPNPKNRLP